MKMITPQIVWARTVALLGALGAKLIGAIARADLETIVSRTGFLGLTNDGLIIEEDDTFRRRVGLGVEEVELELVRLKHADYGSFVSTITARRVNTYTWSSNRRSSP